MGRVKGTEKILDYHKNHPTISMLGIGESGYIPPWQFKLVKNGDLFMPDIKIEHDLDNKCRVKVTRVFEQKDGFDVDFSDVDEADVDIVESEKNLSDGNNCVKWIKIGNLNGKKIIKPWRKSHIDFGVGNIET